MAVTATRKITVDFSGDVDGTQVVNAASNAASPGSVEVKTLAAGLNTITVPTGGTTVTGVTIIPPAGNTQSITLKGVTGDTGIRLHDTDPTSLSLHSSVTSFALTAGAQVTGLRLLWS